MIPKNLHTSAAGTLSSAQKLEEEAAVRKSVRSLVLGGPIPGAYAIRGRPSGEIPSWHHEHYRDQTVDDLEESSSSAAAGINGYVPPPEGTRDRNVLEIQDDDDILIAELATPPHLVIEGVKQASPWPRRFLQLVGTLLASSLIAVAAGTIATKLVTADSGTKYSPSGGQNETRVTKNIGITNATDHNYDRGNTNWTIAAAMEYEAENEGAFSSLRPFIDKSTTQIFFAELNRTDTLFTLFSLGNEAKLFEGIDMSVISKMVSPLWNGHTLDVRTSAIVEGQALAEEDMYDGMVLTSIAGYPVVIHLNPFRVNTTAIAEEHRNLRYKNGIVHKLVQYPNPIVPWIGKSSFDVLREANMKRSGDLSVFIGLIEESPDIMNQLLLEDGDTKAITLFAPTNDALLAVLEPGLVENSLLLRVFLQNHMVSGNFAKSCWWTIPTGTAISETELWLETQAGQLLKLSIPNDESVTIDGAVTLIGRELFSEQGIIHVIDRPLMV